MNQVIRVFDEPEGKVGALYVLVQRIEDEAAKQGWGIRSVSVVMADRLYKAVAVMDLPAPPEIVQEPRDGRKDIPLKAGATAPTVPAFLKTPDGLRPVQAMAGVFGVPEGEKLSPTDDEPAPPPLLSKSCDLRKYGDVFGNLEEPHA